MSSDHEYYQQLLPDIERLTTGLRTGLGREGVTVLHRRLSEYSSSFPSEVVTCRLAGGDEIRLFCKYGIGADSRGHGHKRGTSYEHVVYRSVLEPSGLPVPKALGDYTDPASGSRWLMLEFLENNLRLDQVATCSAMCEAARWIGQFHRVNEPRVAELPEGLLIQYDCEYYLGFAQRACEFAGDLHQRFPWFRELCDRFEEAVAILMMQPQTVIHGEYTPKNILCCQRGIFPVDWESAGAAAGEVDLAAVADGWPEEIQSQCAQEYAAARWPHGAPAGFDRTLSAARLYMTFRWLGDNAGWTRNSAWRFEALHQAGKQLGLI